MKTDELISEAISLPVEVRTLLVNKLHESLNPPDKEIDKLWVEEAEKRVEELRTGKVKTIPGEDVFGKIRKKINP
ncbi:MAG: addiction module protein [Nitrospirota bacterium]|nr:addiction module protein [Nitrospirota bacterium]